MPRALVLLDPQNEWADPASEYFVGEISPLVARLRDAVTAARARGEPVVFFRHLEPEGEAFRDGSPGAEFLPGIGPAPGDLIFEKSTIGGFLGTDFEKNLRERGVDRLAVGGLLTNLCVRKMVEDAYDLGFEIEILRDGSQTFDAETHDFTIRDLVATRPEIEVLTVAEFAAR